MPEQATLTGVLRPPVHAAERGRYASWVARRTDNPVVVAQPLQRIELIGLRIAETASRWSPLRFTQHSRETTGGH